MNWQRIFFFFFLILENFMVHTVNSEHMNNISFKF